jgi:hypothetical protein
MFAVVDATVLAEALKYRWLTDSNGRPLRSTYCARVKRSVPETLARFVWRVAKGTLQPELLAHENADLLDCRADNLKAVKYPSQARSKNTGECVSNALGLAGYENAAAARTALGISLEGTPAPRGKKCSVSPENVRKILDARRDVAPSYTLGQFNAEVVKTLLGEELAPLLLSKIIHGVTGRLPDYDYEKVPVFRKKFRYTIDNPATL